MESRVKRAIILFLYFIIPLIVSIVYWIEEPLDGSDILNNLMHRIKFGH